MKKDTFKQSEKGATTTCSADEKELLSFLASGGLNIRCVDDLLKVRLSKSDVAILLEALPKAGRFKEVVVRSLADKVAKGIAAPTLIEEFLRLKGGYEDFEDPDGQVIQMPTGDSALKWVIGMALAKTATAESTDELVRICLDNRHGASRKEIVSCLHRFKSNPAVLPALLELLDQEDVAAHALEALRKMKAKQARGKAKALLDHPRPLIRREAKKLLNKIDS